MGFSFIHKHINNHGKLNVSLAGGAGGGVMFYSWLCGNKIDVQNEM